MKSYTLEDVQNKLIGERGTPYRDKYEQDLAFELNRNKNTSDDFNELADNIEKIIALEFSNFKDLIEENKLSYSSSAWTKTINQKLIACKPKDYLVASKTEGSDNSEWLYDLVWYSENGFGLDKVALIVESEWKNASKKDNYYWNVKYDFEKLLLGRASHRLAIFEGNNSDEISQIQHKLKEIISNSKITTINDRYMFAAWNGFEQEFYFDVYIV